MDTNSSPAKIRSFSPDMPVLALCALVFLVLRFAALSLAPFSRDEPNLQNLIDHAFAEGRVPLLGLVGTYGLRYGPTGMWFYLPLRVFTSDARAIVAWHALSYLVAFLLLFRSLFRSDGLRAAAWALALSSTSPLLFLDSRLAWDNTLLVPIIAGLLWALERYCERNSAARAVALGVIAGLAMGTHPVAAPAVAAALLTAWLFSPVADPRRNLRGLGVVLAAILVCLAPYLVALLSWHAAMPGSTISSPAGSFTSVFPALFFGPTQFLAAEPARYFFAEDFPALLNAMPLPLTWAASALATLAVTFVGWMGVARGTRLPRTPARMFALFSVLAAFVFFLALRPEPMQPHYLTPLWWVAIYFAAQALGSTKGRAGLALRIVATLLLLANAGFLVGTLRYLSDNAGTREAHYGSALGEIENATAALCGRITPEGAVLDLAAVPGVSPPSVAFLSRHLAECRGKKLSIIPQVSPLETSLPRFHFVYGPGASLRVE
jgi:hypothetical protein